LQLILAFAFAAFQFFSFKFCSAFSGSSFVWENEDFDADVTNGLEAVTFKEDQG